MNDEKWREKNICHTCLEQDDCDEGKKRNHSYGSIVIKCTAHKKMGVKK